MAPISPAVASWALGQRLREKRSELGLTASAATKQFGFTAAYLSEVENGKTRLSEARLDSLISTYEIEDDEAEELRRLREEAGHRGWWNDYTALFSDELLRFFGYEHGAESIRTYSGGIINGLLQTEDYARAVMESGGPNVRLAEVERRLECRMLRQQRVTGDDPAKLNAVMGEAVLWQQIGGPHVLKAQLDRLAELVEEYPDTLDVRIVPFSSTGHDAVGGSPFYLMTFPSGKLPALLWQEAVTSTQLISEALTVREHGLAHAEATNAALNRQDSLDAIRKASSQL